MSQSAYNAQMRQASPDDSPSASDPVSASNVDPLPVELAYAAPSTQAIPGIIKGIATLCALTGALQAVSNLVQLIISLNPRSNLFVATSGNLFGNWSHLIEVLLLSSEITAYLFMSACAVSVLRQGKSRRLLFVSVVMVTFIGLVTFTVAFAGELLSIQTFLTPLAKWYFSAALVGEATRTIAFPALAAVLLRFSSRLEP